MISLLDQFDNMMAHKLVWAPTILRPSIFKEIRYHYRTASVFYFPEKHSKTSFAVFI